MPTGGQEAPPLEAQYENTARSNVGPVANSEVSKTAELLADTRNLLEADP
jgi:hypothetical protein